MGGSGIRSGSAAEPPHIIEESSGKTYALSGAWVTLKNVKYVRLQNVGKDLEIVPGTYVLAIERQKDDATTYELANFDIKDSDSPMSDRIEDRLDAILAGKAESGPLE